METIVDYVQAFESDANADRSVLLLKNGQQFTVPHDARLNAWKKAVAAQQESDRPVYVEVDRATGKLTALYMLLPRQTEAITPSPDGATVTFARAPASYHLLKERGAYERMRTLLQKSLELQKPALVAVQPSTLEILAVEPAQ